MPLTKQQSAVVDTIQQDGVSLVKVEAVAGAGKTSTLIALSKLLNPKIGMYLAYNKAISEEATLKFKGTNIRCSTIHSLAYQAVVKQYGLKVGFFGIRDVQPNSMPYKVKAKVVSVMDELLLSKYIHVADFFDNVDVEPHIQDIIKEHLDLMTNGDISCSHSFYLKLYHILLANGQIAAPEVDLLMIDEAGDLTPISLDIFKLIKSPKKIMVGDAMQNIYSFNNTINGFKSLANEGVTVPLTQSFRVSEQIASRIEGFCRTHVDPGFEFKGREYPAGTTVDTHGFIARTNSGLVAEMFGLMAAGVQFNVTRPIDTILELPLILANLGNGRPITNFKYKAVEKLRKEWENDPILQRTYSTVNKYVRKIMVKDDEICRGFDVVFKHGTPDLNKLASYVRTNAASKHALTLTTAHSSKGLEFTAVTLAEDMNDALATALEDIAAAKRFGKQDLVNSLSEEIRLYYVACSRCMIELNNARHLPRGMLTT